MTSSILTEQAWHQERFDTYLNISRQVQSLHILIPKARDATKELHDRKEATLAANMYASLLTYNIQYEVNAAKPDLDSITDIDKAEKAFEESKVRAKQVWEMLWGEQSFAGAEEFNGVKELLEARELVKQIVEVDLVGWEKRVRDVAEMGRILTA